MNIIGFSGLHHSVPFKKRHFPSLAPREYRIAQGFDAAAALVTKNGVAAAAAEERFIQEKSTPRFPIHAIRYCLQVAGIGAEQISSIAHGFAYQPVKSAFEFEIFSRQQYAEVYDPVRQIECLQEHFPSVDWTKKFVAVPHHLAHAASTFYLSGFEESLIVITDGMGELNSMTALVGNREGMKIIQEIPAFHSLGILYGVFTLYLGFDFGLDEYKVMGLAPYGNPRRYFNQIMDFVRLKPDGTYAVPLFAQNKSLVDVETHRGVCNKLAERFGPPRHPGESLTQQHMDIAAGLQSVLQTCQLHLLKHLKEQSGQSHLCMAGGTALNCTINGIIHRSHLFKKMFVQPAAGDDGTALGAALYVQHSLDPSCRNKKMALPFWGPVFPEYDAATLPEFLNKQESCEYTYYQSIQDLTRHVADRLAQGQVIAWFQGSMEFGPRALGNRSILADPRNPAMRDHVNSLIKKREGFRPFAPAVIAEAAGEFFYMEKGEEDIFAHMLYVVPVRPQYRTQLPAITHVDGSARVQTVGREHNERFWLLLSEFGRLTGVPILLNTSFNVRGQPIVCTPKEAIETFVLANLDALVIGHYLLVRNDRKKSDTMRVDGKVLADKNPSARSDVKPFSCFIIGETNLPIQCAEMLLDRGHTIHGIVSPDEHVLSWASQRAIPTMKPPGDLLAFLSQQPFDYLFSTLNLLLLPPEVLQIARRESINYHDAPLPRYAGLHSTSWALFNQERTHGITWHVMTEQTDAGDILKQAFVNIDPDESALTLNVKCHEAAVHTFGELIDELAQGHVIGRAQDLTQRTYFKKIQRPTLGCLLSWKWEARQIDSFIRALDFGPYPNPLGSPKIVIGSEFFILKKIEVLPTPSKAFPGTITAIFPNAIRIATGSTEINISEFLTLTGRPISLSEVLTRHDLVEGRRFEDLDEIRTGILQARYESICRQEAFWLKRLSERQPLKLSYTSPSGFPKEHTEFPCLTQTFSEEKNFVPKNHSNVARGDFLLAAHLAYFSRIHERSVCDVGFAWERFLEHVVGLESFFSLTAPLRMTWNAHQTFQEFSETVYKEIVQIQKRGPFPLDLFSRCARMNSNHQENMHEEFPVIFVRNIQFTRNHLGAESYAGALSVFLPDDGKEYHWRYNPELLAKRDVECMHNQFTTFLSQVVDDPEQVLSDIPLVSQYEKRKILQEWNQQSDQVTPSKLCIHHLVEDQVERNPDAIAIVLETACLTFDQLNRHANKVAHYLQKLGVKPDIVVGLCMERSVETIVGLLGILKAGGCYLPLDPTLPSERLRLMLQNSGVSILLTRKSSDSDIPDYHGKVVCFEKEWKKILCECGENSLNSVASDNLAYEMYTSGSTGRPKGVMIAHQSLVNYIQTLTQTHELKVRDRMLQFASIGFDTSVEEIFGALASGATLVLRTESMLDSIQQFLDRCRDWCITVLDLPTAFWHELGTTLHDNNLNLPPLIRLVIIGGEQALPHQLELWEQAVSSELPLFNYYGPTEGTIVTTGQAMNGTRHKSLFKQGVPIGRPVGGVRVYPLDKRKNLVPVGVPGEIYVGGGGVARGYRSSSDVTAEKFVPDHLSGQPGQRLYKTGDFGTWTSDGILQFSGRKDNQVKIRGYRIELGEIESVLVKHPRVQNAVVVCREDTLDLKQLVGYAVVKAPDPPTTTELMTWLKRTLPDYMVPSVFVLLEQFPLTPNGKIDRKALPLPKQPIILRE